MLAWRMFSLHGWNEQWTGIHYQLNPPPPTQPITQLGMARVISLVMSYYTLQGHRERTEYVNSRKNLIRALRFMGMPINRELLFFMWNPTLLYKEQWHHLPQLLHSSLIWCFRVRIGIVTASAYGPNWRCWSGHKVPLRIHVTHFHRGAVVLLTVSKPSTWHLKLSMRN